MRILVKRNLKSEKDGKKAEKIALKIKKGSGEIRK